MDEALVAELREIIKYARTAEKRENEDDPMIYGRVREKMSDLTTKVVEIAYRRFPLPS